MNIYPILSLFLLIVVIILGVMVYRGETCSQKDYSKCYLSKDSSTCIPDTIKNAIGDQAYEQLCKNKEGFKHGRYKMTLKDCLNDFKTPWPEYSKCDSIHKAYKKIAEPVIITNTDL